MKKQDISISNAAKVSKIVKYKIESSFVQNFDQSLLLYITFDRPLNIRQFRFHKDVSDFNIKVKFKVKLCPPPHHPPKQNVSKFHQNTTKHCALWKDFNFWFPSYNGYVEWAPEYQRTDYTWCTCMSTGMWLTIVQIIHVTWGASGGVAVWHHHLNRRHSGQVLVFCKDMQETDWSIYSLCLML